MKVLSKLKTYLRRKRLSRKQPAEIFSDYARRNKWRDKDSLSGKGSNLASTAELRINLPPLLESIGAKKLLDLPCGDFFWMQKVVLPNVEYFGGDIVESIIETNRNKYAAKNRRFEVIDLIVGPIPEADVVLVRDCLVHLSTQHILQALANIKKSGSTWLLTTTYPETGTNAEIPTGDWRAIDLTKHPFNLPGPDRLLFEGQGHLKGQRPDKALGLWRVDSIPNIVLENGK